MDKRDERWDTVKLRSFVTRYVDAHGGEVRGIRVDLDQLRTLLDDAESRLTSSFETIATLTKRQGDLALAILAQAAPDADAVPRAPSASCMCPGCGASMLRVTEEIISDTDESNLSVLTQDIRRSVSATVTALQFHDMASQIIAQVSHRVDMLEEMGVQVGGLPDASIDELAKALTLACNAPGRNPVAQMRMTVGAVELF